MSITDLTALLDELDATREKATPGEWSNPEYTSTVYGGDPAQLLRVASSVHPDDAALIVAAVNNLPKLTAELRKRDAALRAVVELADNWARAEDEAGCPQPHFRYVADRIFAALAPEQAS